MWRKRDIMLSPEGHTVRVNVDVNLKRLLLQEDTDGDNRITIEDRGSKRFQLKSVEGVWYEVAGTYRLAILLQELAMAKEAGKKTVCLSIDRLFENQVDHLSRLIRDRFWDGLTRRIDAEGIAELLQDDKFQNAIYRNIYVPYGDKKAFKYFTQLAQSLNINVERLPAHITPEYVRSLDDKPGILSLALKETDSGELRGVPFVVPGGRFNELYGWDSYFEVLGLVQDRRVDLAQGIADNLVYEIIHYGKILNANRTYYLTRSQPPFLTSIAKAIYQALPELPASTEWLATILRAAISEYKTVWIGSDRLTDNGLSRYHGLGIGMPIETEPDHLDAIFYPYAQVAQIPINEYRDGYYKGTIIQPQLDEIFIHDRAMRESGHDTTYRLLDCAANLNTVDLNSLLYRYEMDIAFMIKNYFGDHFFYVKNSVMRSDEWVASAEKRKATMNELMWNEERGMFFDYDFITHKQTLYESCTTFYPLWAGLATPKQAERLVKHALPLFEAPGGLLASTEASRGEINLLRPQRQWDYPFGWAPHQMLAWMGFKEYGYNDITERLAYRWLYMITRDAADYNGVVPEKYDVISRSHKVYAEYGNVGSKFDYITPAGFGWMNASYQVGLSFISKQHRQYLSSLRPPEWIFGGMPHSQNICLY